MEKVMAEKEKVVIGMSGGVDSSVAAYLLQQQGYDVIGVTVQTWRQCVSAGDVCDIPDDVKDAERVAGMLGIPHDVIDFSQEFRNEVIDYFIREYRSGRTPNPCVVCNRRVKWEALLCKAKELGAEYVATGHYARVLCLPNGRYTVATSAAVQKEQSYVLFNLTQEQLKHTLMPLGEYEKPEIRRIAARIGLEVADKPDSQEICFVPDHDYAGFIERETGQREETGDFVTKSGEVLGRHKGISHYTVGQRKGLNLAMGHPVFVTQLRPETREVVIGEAEDVFTDTMTVEDVNFMGAERFEAGQKLLVKIRYAHKGSLGVVEACEETADGGVRLSIRFPEKVRAVTPGQAAVFYEWMGGEEASTGTDDMKAVLGGGIIKN